MKITVATILTLICIKVSAQNSDLIITTSNDTILVDKVSIKADYIKVRKNKKNKRYSYSEIKSLYKLERKSYYDKIENSVHINSDEDFMKREVDGKIKFYGYYMHAQGGGQGYSYYFISKNGIVRELSGGMFRFGTESVLNKIRTFIDDDNEILNELNSIKKLKIKDLIKLLKKYNQNYEIEKKSKT
jgi:hypothetical protein